MNETILLLILIFLRSTKNNSWSFKLSKWIAANLDFIDSLSL